ncbi:MAG: LysR family transcriptional regulator [Polymorphobacter sp.]|uniref:LysR family transcriptional regulator n=1 Tax=Polymorphobacter sp. TaxID=1909290 RepID=UPI003A85261D
MKTSYTIQRGLLDGIEPFLRVAARKSFRAAADDLGVSPSAVSQSVRALEERMGVALLTRTTRSVGLTEAGQRLLDDAAPAFQRLTAAYDAARTYGERPAGLLRINMPRATMALVIEPIIASFCARYPEIDLEIAGEDGLIDLAETGFDAGIRIGELLDADMVALRLSEPFRYLLVAAPDYLARKGRPASLADLKAHDCIRMRYQSGTIAPWIFKSGNREVEAVVRNRLITNDLKTLHAMAVQGLGIAFVSEPLVADHLASATLMPVLEDYQHSSPGLFLHYPSRKQVAPKLRAFIDHLRDEIRAGRVGQLVRPR